MEVVKTVQLKGNRTLELVYDTDSENPRTAMDNLGIMAIFHRRCDFGDKVDFSSDDFNGWDEIEEHIRKECKALAILPIYMYDHSGITINTTGFSCQWDSGQIGFIYTTQKRLDELGVTINNEEDWCKFKERLTTYLNDEVETQDTWIRGEVYGMRVLDADGEEENSCWGFYGDDIRENGVMDHIGADEFLDLGEL